MGNTVLKLACWDYDRTRPLIDGRVKPEGIELNISVLRPREAFTRMLEGEEFDLAEMSLATFVRLIARGDKRFVGLPVALSRMFRHSCIYVRAGSGIRKPEDLRGRKVGVAQLDSTGAVFIKGMLAHDYKVMPNEIEWSVGGIETPSDIPAPAQGHGNIRKLAPNQSAVSAFAAGEIDGIISNHVPSLFFDNSSGLVRIFQDFKSIEKDHYVRTGIFPIMHILVMRSSLYSSDPTLADDVYNMFCKAKALSMKALYDTDALRLTLPWLIDHLDEAINTFGPDYWPYGVKQNAAVWEAISGFVLEQELATRFVDARELFVCG